VPNEGTPEDPPPGRRRTGHWPWSGVKKERSERSVAGPSTAPVTFEEFVRVQGDSLVRLSYVLCGDRGKAEDAAQEALTRVYLRWGRIEDPLPYARQAVVNATNDEWRRFGRDRRREERVAAEPVEPVEQFDVLLANRDRLVQALRSLPYGQRTIVVLRYWQQLSEPETAQVLGVSVGTVKSQASRALRRLRELLSSDLSPVR
jgi:RNA polymerase sigma-70 factor (sigma-E family)